MILNYELSLFNAYVDAANVGPPKKSGHTTYSETQPKKRRSKKKKRKQSNKSKRKNR